MQTPDFLAKAVQLAKTNSPEIMTALGVSGVVTTAYLTGKASYSAARSLAEESPHMSVREKARQTWRLYVPAGISGTITVVCIIGSSKAGGRRTAAAVTAYTITERAFGEYREKVVEHLGESKERTIRDEISQDHVAKHPAVLVTGTNGVLCCELYTGRYFRSDMETLRKAQNDVNAKIVNRLYVTLEDFYDILGLVHTTNSDQLGWDSDRLMDLVFSTSLSDSNEPCLAFEYNYVKPL